MPPTPAIEAFWIWWNGDGRGQCEQAIDTGDWNDVTDELDRLVEAIGPGLQWEFGAGVLSQHVLCVSGAGNSELRPTAERWLMAAPPSDDQWEFRSARAPDPSVFSDGVGFSIGERSLSPSELRLTAWVDEERQMMDVVLWHPDLEGADDGLRHTAMLLMMDWLLGEDAVERWIGHIDLADAEPPEALLPSALVTAVEELERSNLEPTYALMSGTVDDRPVMVIARRPLKRVEFPLFDLRIDARVVFDDQTPDGFPGPERLDGLTALEEDLSARLGDLGIVAAVLTRDGVRTFHIYCDQQGSGPAVAQSWVAEHPDEMIVLSFEIDPAWEAVAQFC